MKTFSLNQYIIICEVKQNTLRRITDKIKRETKNFYITEKGFRFRKSDLIETGYNASRYIIEFSDEEVKTIVLKEQINVLVEWKNLNKINLSDLQDIKDFLEKKGLTL